jgi:hypothetical protein
MADYARLTSLWRYAEARAQFWAPLLAIALLLLVYPLIVLGRALVLAFNELAERVNRHDAQRVLPMPKPREGR